MKSSILFYIIGGSILLLIMIIGLKYNKYIKICIKKILTVPSRYVNINFDDCRRQ